MNHAHSALALPAHDEKAYVRLAVAAAVGLVALVVALTARKPTMALAYVLPLLICNLGVSGAAIRWAHGRGWPAARSVALSTAAAALGTSLALAVLHALYQHRWGGGWLYRPEVWRALVAGPCTGLLVGCVALGLRRARHRERQLWADHAARQIAQERLQRERLQAELQLLQAQVEPHFLYNTLANLRQLIRTDTERALAMLEHLIRYFKLALPAFRRERLPLGDEVALVQAYLGLLRERTGVAMHLALSLPAGDGLEALIPAGALLCLVENAVKHGLPAGGAALQLQLDVSQQGDRLCLALRDNGPGLRQQPTPGSTGTGLANLRERMKLLYGSSCSLQLVDTGQGCEAVMELPCQTA